jgi:orotidine-5'-phosphate decarboxylase
LPQGNLEKSIVRHNQEDTTMSAFNMPNFADKLCAAIEKKKSILCIGLDPQLRYMPPFLIVEAIKRHGRTLEAIGWLYATFNRAIIDATHDLGAVYKPNLAFYSCYGSHGLRAFEETVRYAKSSGTLVIADGKCGDGGDTATAYAEGYLGRVPFFAEPGSDILSEIVSSVRADCLTIHGYIGEDCINRFVKVAKEYGTGIFVVAKTSFKPNSRIEQLTTVTGLRVWEETACLVEELGGDTLGAYGLRNVGVVVGATYPGEATNMRKLLPNSFFLKPGLGSQGASADDAIIGIGDDGFGVIVNDSRNLTFAWQNMKGDFHCQPENFASAARNQAIADVSALTNACKKAGKWPF